MPNFRTTVVAAVLSTLTVIGALPATASAATSSIRWETPWGTTLRVDSSADVCAPGTFDDLEEGGTVTVELHVSGSWVTKRTVPVVGQWTRCVSVVPGEMVAGPGRYSFRARYRSTPGASVLEASTTLTLAKDQSFGHVPGDEHFSRTTTPGRAVTAFVSPARGQLVDLQRRSGDRWIRIGRVRAVPGGSYDEGIRVPVPARAGLSRYRLSVHGTTWSSPSVSSVFTMHQTDMARHWAYITQARRHMARFCPSTPIFVDTPAVTQRGGPVGWATTSSQPAFPGRPGQISAQIELRSGLSGGALRHIALHECAHVVQNRPNVVGRADAEERGAWQLWPQVGDEGQADCMAYERTRTARYLYYVRGCNARQLANAARMWRDYGTRFQAEPYTWGG